MTANQMTLLHTVVGFFGCALIGMGDLWSLAAGTTLLQVSCMLDLCDGELARAKLIESNGGQWLDTVCDHSTHLAFIVGLTVGYMRFAAAQGLSWAAHVPALGGLTSAVAVALVLGLVIYVRRHRLGGSLNAVARDYDARVTGPHRGAFFAGLHQLRILGERDQFTPIIASVGVAAWLWQSAFFYHVLFFGTLIVVQLMLVYFAAGALKARSLRTA